MSAQDVAQRPQGNAAERTQQVPRAHGGGGSVAGLMGAAGTLLLMAGAPILLLRLGVLLPIEPDLLTPGLLLRPDDGTLLLVLLLALAWTAWALVAVSLLLEVWALARRRPVPSVRGLGPAQRLAANMVASMTVAVALVGPGVSASAQGTAPSLAAAVQNTTRVGADAEPARPVSPLERGVERGAQSSHAADASLPIVVVGRHDTLWMLAELHLGDGARFDDIVRLNRGVPQPDGRALGQDGRIRPGWRLRLPADARLDVTRPHVHHVEPGESLWAIAKEELGDGTRYPEIFLANRGDLQPDGGRLRDPDLIRPSWELVVPTGGDAGGGGTAQPAARGGDRLPGLERGGPAPATADASAGLGGEEGRSRAAVPQGSPGPDPTLPPLDRSATATATPGPTQQLGSPRAVPPPAAVERAGFDAVIGTLDDPAVALPAQGVLGVLALAGLAREVARRRRDAQRQGSSAPAAEPTSDEARRLGELAALALDHRLVALLDRSLRQLGASASAAGARPPALRLLRASTERIVLELMSEHSSAFPPFRSIAPTRWELDTGALTEAPPDHPPAYPALITVGFDAEDAVLVDLVEIGVLRVAGPSASVGQVQAALSAEVAFGPAAGHVEHVVDLPEPILARSQSVGTVEVTGTRASAASGAQVLAERARIESPSRRGDAPTPRGPMEPRQEQGGRPADASDAAGRMDDALSEDPPLVLVTAAAELPPRARGVGVIWADPAAGRQTPGDAGPGAPAGMVLHVDGDRAILNPGDVPLTPPRLPIADERSLAAVLDAADRPLPVPTLTHERSALTRPSDPEATDRPAPRLLVLGEVIVLGASGRVDRSRISRLAETTAFVHLNPGSRPSHLQGALWPGRAANPQSCRQMLSRTRTWLGRDECNRPYLMAFTESDGRLRLRESVSSDWQDFRRLADEGLTDPQDRAQLSAALALVRGRPLGPLAGRGVGWADVHVGEMLGWIADVAHELAQRHLRDGRRDLARAAVLRALTTEMESEVLHDLLASLGDPTVGKASA